MNALKGYKTVGINLVAVLIPAVGIVLDNPAIVGALTGPSAPLWLAALGGLNLILRALTDTPMFKQEPKQNPDSGAR